MLSITSQVSTSDVCRCRTHSTQIYVGDKIWKGGNKKKQHNINKNLTVILKGSCSSFFCSAELCASFRPVNTSSDLRHGEQYTKSPKLHQSKSHVEKPTRTEQQNSVEIATRPKKYIVLRPIVLSNRFAVLPIIAPMKRTNCQDNHQSEIY